MKKGFPYYTIDADRYQDRRIKRLKRAYGCEGLTVYDYVLCEVYRVEGYYISWDDDIVFDISDYLDLTTDRISEIVAFCAEIGLFEQTLFEQNIITSAAIQSRYVEMCRRTNRTVKIPTEYDLLSEKTADDESEKMSDKRGQMSDKAPQISDKIGQISDKRGQMSDFKTHNKVKENKINNNSLSLSLSPSESRESESGEDIGGVSAADRESFFEILFFRNFKNPQKEVERLIDHYSAVGWRRHGDIRAVKDKKALARNWKPQSENDIGRFQPDVLAKLQAAYAEIKAESPEDASTIIHGTRKIDDIGDHVRIFCASKSVEEAYRRHLPIVIANNLTNGKRGMFSYPNI